MLGNFGMIAEVMINDADRPKQGNYLYGAFGRNFYARRPASRLNSTPLAHAWASI